jgi:MFS transporter, ACS family, D-galactonate transporter
MSHRIVVLLALAVLINYVDRGNLAVAAPILTRELALTNSQLGVLLSAFFWTYAPAQILGGWLSDRFDTRVVLAGGLTLWSIATGLTGLAQGFTTLLLLRVLLGLGECVTFPSCVRLLAQHTPEHARGSANGILAAGQALGPTLGTLLGGLLMARFGWRAVFIGSAVGSLLWLWPWTAFVRGMPMAAPRGPVETSVTYMTILRQPAAWAGSLGHFSVNYGYYFMLTWLPSFLVNARGFNVAEMAKIGALVYCIHAVCSTLAGMMADRLTRRGMSTHRVLKRTIVTGILGSAATIALSATTEGRATVVFLALTGVFFGLISPMVSAIVQTLAGPVAAGRWYGAQNVSGQMAGVVAPLVTGFIVDRTGQFYLAFMVSAGVLLLAGVAYGALIPRIEPVRWADDGRELTARI